MTVLYKDFVVGQGEGIQSAVTTGGQPGRLIATTADGVHDDSLHAPLSVRASRAAAGTHLASLPNGAFEDGLDAWTHAGVGGASVEVDASTSIIGVNSIRMHCASASDVATLTSSPVPCGEGVPMVAMVRSALTSGSVAQTLTALFYDKAMVSVGTVVLLAAAVPGASFAEALKTITPPTGTRYGALALSVQGVAGAINVDELRLTRRESDTTGTVHLDDFPGANDIERWQAAHDHLGPRGGTIQLPARDIVLDTSLGAISYTNPVISRGHGWAETLGAGGTRIVLPDHSRSPFVLSGLNARGARFENFSIIQTGHAASAPGWTPAPYPAVFAANDIAGIVTWDNLLCFDVRALIDAFNTGRPEILNVKGQFFDYLAAIDQCLDCPFINYIRAWPYDEDLIDIHVYTQANLKLLKLYRVDSPFIHAVFGIFAHAAVWFGDRGNGVCTGFKIDQVDADISFSGMFFDASCDGTRGTVNGYVGTLRNLGIDVRQQVAQISLTGSGAIIDNGTGVRLSYSDLDSSFAGSSGIQQNGSNGYIHGSNTSIQYWAHGPSVSDHAAPAVHSNPTGGNRLYLANTPTLPNDVNGLPSNIDGNGVIEGLGPQLWAPTFTPAAGAFATPPQATNAIFLRRNGEIKIYLDILMPDAGGMGTATGNLSVSLPFMNDRFYAVINGSECALSGVGLTGRVGPNSGSMGITVASTNGPVCIAGYRIVMTGSYLPAVD